MKPNRFSFASMTAATCGLAALLTTGLVADEKSSPSSPAKPAAPSAVVAAPAAIPVSVPATWQDLKDFTYDTRAGFFVAFKNVLAVADARVAELTAARAAMTSDSYTKDWDFAMKELGNSRSYLKSTGEEMRQATPETWEQMKAKVGQAWERSQEAYAKVKSSRTS